MTLCQRFTPQLGLNMGMDRRGNPTPPLESGTVFVTTDGSTAFTTTDDSTVFIVS